MSPVYETPEDREKERAALELFSAAFGVECVRNGRFAHFDAGIWLRSRLVGAAEVKARGRLYPDHLILSCTKWYAAAELWNKHGEQFRTVVIVATDEGVWYAHIAPRMQYRLEWRGRRDRPGDSKGVEPCILIPREDFARVS